MNDTAVAPEERKPLIIDELAEVLRQIVTHQQLIVDDYAKAVLERYDKEYNKTWHTTKEGRVEGRKEKKDGN